jgi:hypothetical protein
LPTESNTTGTPPGEIFAHARGDVLGVAVDGEGVAVGERELALVGAAGNADHLRAEMAAPLSGQDADAARRGIEHRLLAGIERVAAVDQVFDGHALEQRRDREFVADAVGNPDETRRRRSRRDRPPRSQ